MQEITAGPDLNFVCALTESSPVIAMGYYVDCDSALCRECLPGSAGEWARGNYQGWKGFEGWESPSVIFTTSESDSPTHCAACGRVIAHDLTADGKQYITDALADYLSPQPSSAHAALVRWMYAYGDDIEMPQEFMDEFIAGFVYELLDTDTVAEDEGGNKVHAQDFQTPAGGWELATFDKIDQAAITEECADFVRSNWWYLGQAISHTYTARQAGGDFLLTRNGHGTGYWDRGLDGIGDYLSQATKPCGDMTAWCYHYDDPQNDGLAHLF